MNKIKLLSLSAIALSVFGVATPSLITTVDAGVISQVSKNETHSKELTPTEAEQFSKYFELSEDGSVKFTATQQELIKEFGFSEKDAALAVSIDNGPSAEQVSLRQRGFVGLRIVFGRQTKKMSGWAAAAYVAGYCGFYLKTFAATPATAGAVAIISASIGATVKFAIDKGMNATNVGVNIPFVAKTIIVRTP